MKSLSAIRRNKKVESVVDERRPGEADPEQGNGIWAYLKPGWQFDDTHACHEYTVEELAQAVRWAEPCDCDECRRRKS